MLVRARGSCPSHDCMHNSRRPFRLTAFGWTVARRSFLGLHLAETYGNLSAADFVEYFLILALLAVRNCCRLVVDKISDCCRLVSLLLSDSICQVYRSVFQLAEI
jgi:hypothetical protein